MEFLNKYFKYENNIQYSGLTEELIVIYINKLFQTMHRNIIVVTSSLFQSNKLYEKIKLYQDKVFLFPMDDFLSSVLIAASPELKYKRLETLDKLKNSKKGIVFTNLMGYLKYLPDKKSPSFITINENAIIKRNVLIDKLNELGYYRESLVTQTGEYAVRGFIIDIFPLHEDHPVRIEYAANKIIDLRYFDENSQLSNTSISKITIKTLNEQKTIINNSLLDYCCNPIVVFIDSSQINATYNKLTKDISMYQNHKDIKDCLMYKMEELNPNYKIFLNSFNSGLNDLKSTPIENYNSNFALLKKDCGKYKKAGKEIYFYLANDKQKKFIKNIIKDAKVFIKKINNGFCLDNYIVIGENDLEKTQRTNINYKTNYHLGKKIKDFDQLKKGDYVVHVSHGIGIYMGITSLKVRGMTKDFIEIVYQDNDKIYVPVEKINTIYKYTDKEGKVPKLNKLGSLNWEKTKKYVTSKVKDISRELIKLYKERLEIKSKPYQDFIEEEEFAQTFKYELTKDQKKSIIEINNDLKSLVPMDRLLCGDVGFGKTEVAMRAMFKTVINNHQVMYLCPTTILSKQQYLVAKDRFNKWPIEIELLNRNISSKKVKEITTNFKTGKIDILIGTHRLLSKDIIPKDLGLLVIDEEQRFGVGQKEKIKKFQKDINILTLSATPIPRTLKMSLSGLRDLSVIDSPPVNRYPVQTYVILQDDLIIKDAIYKELSRKGQIFILFNRIDKIEEFTINFRKLIPEAKIVFAHGQMDKDTLDNIMTDFIEQKYDILICTTIIENGIDIPNVNTLIIYNADNFGLSQLYQIRGRVGRSNKIAYAYLLYDKNKILNEVAIKRLEAIKEFTELGSGYRIAMRDLSLRGAGDIFGANQAGFIDSVGIQLYMKMIDNEVKRLQGIEITLEDEKVNALINVATHISDEYISDEDVKIEIHQKINAIDSYSKLLTIKKELEDRFGKMKEELLIYMYEEWFERIAEKHGIKTVNQTNRYIEVELPINISREIKGDKLLIEASSLTKNFKIKYHNNKIIIILYYNNLPKHFIFYLVTLLEKVL